MFDLDSLDLSRLTKEEIIAGAKSIVEHVNERILHAQGEVDNMLDIVSMVVRKQGGVVMLTAEEQGLPPGKLIVKGNKENGSVTLTFAVMLVQATDADATGTPAAGPGPTTCGCDKDVRCETHTPKLVLSEQSE